MVDGRAARVVVLGAGFAGLRAVRRLARAGVRVLWVDGRNYHCFLPLLYQVAIAGLEPQEIAYPARSILRRLPSAEFRLARVVAGDPAARTLLTATGDRLAYDYLIVATGGVAEYFGIPGAREAALRLYDLEDARLLRNHVLRVLEQAEALDDPAARAALLTFVIVGGGPTGVEMAGALAEFRRHVVPRDYRNVEPHAVRIVLLEAGPELLSPFVPHLRARARRDLLECGVEVRTGAKVTRITEERVELASGETIAARTAIWAAGIRAAPVSAHLGLPTGRSGRVRVDPTLRVPGYPHVFAAGDVAVVDGAERLPQVAQVAIQQGEHAAENVLRSLRGEPCLPFRYRDKGSLATIGRSRAVAMIGRLQVAGRLAWLLWLVVHLVMLIGFRNRLVVLVNWAWSDLTYDFGLRAIVGAEPEPAAALAPTADVAGQRTAIGSS
ncbi:MAG: NAD(P)/FAD-dependent oxidoreductase [Deltaproteobacteria bacterium]|nr:MAG: NAD(P)/FAD-dependent oxidoreductase [Deltaproteobacteria bacterium]